MKVKSYHKKWWIGYFLMAPLLFILIEEYDGIWGIIALISTVCGLELFIQAIIEEKEDKK